MKQYSNDTPFPYLPENREIFTVEESDVFMEEALLEREKSLDKLIPIGIVAVKDSKVIGRSTNKPGYTNKHLIEWHKKFLCVRRWFKAKTGTKYWLCPGCATSKDHGESRLVKEFEKEGKVSELNGADVYMAGHWWCCKPCWDNMLRAGIKHVYIMEGAKEKFDKRTW